jgi:hypothetical protein
MQAIDAQTSKREVAKNGGLGKLAHGPLWDRCPRAGPGRPQPTVHHPKEVNDACGLPVLGPSNPLPCPSEGRIEGSDRVAQKECAAYLIPSWELKFDNSKRS